MSTYLTTKIQNISAPVLSAIQNMSVLVLEEFRMTAGDKKGQ